MSADRVYELIKEAIPGVKVYDAVVNDKIEDLPERYAVYYPDSGRAIAGDVAQTSNGEDLGWQVTCVAASAPGVAAGDLRWKAQWLARQIRDHLLANRITPGGGKVEHYHSEPAGRDETVSSRVLVYAVDKYSART